MPDPSDPTPCKAVRRGSSWAVVGADGSQVEGGGGLAEDAAKALAAQINATWARVKGERRAKGAPEITEARIGPRTSVVLAELNESILGMLRHWDPKLHPRGRGGLWRDVGSLGTGKRNVPVQVEPLLPGGMGQGDEFVDLADQRFRVQGAKPRSRGRTKLHLERWTETGQDGPRWEPAGAQTFPSGEDQGFRRPATGKANPPLYDALGLWSPSTAGKRGTLKNADVREFKVAGTLENRAADVEGINAIIRDNGPGTVVRLQSGVTVMRVAPTGMRAFVIHDADGRPVMDVPAGAPMVAAAYAVALHHRRPRKKRAA